MMIMMIGDEDDEGEDDADHMDEDVDGADQWGGR